MKNESPICKALKGGVQNENPVQLQGSVCGDTIAGWQLPHSCTRRLRPVLTVKQLMQNGQRSAEQGTDLAGGCLLLFMLCIISVSFVSVFVTILISAFKFPFSHCV